MPQITQLADVFASQLFWLVVVFGLIFFGIGRGMVPKVRSTIAARDAKVADDLEKAKAARTRAEETEAEWRARADAARLEASRIAQEAKQQSARDAEARVKAALDEIDAKVERGRLRIRTAVESARVEMENVAAEAAQQMVEQLTGLKIDRKDAVSAVVAELKRVEAGRSEKMPPAAIVPQRMTEEAR